MRCAFGGLDAVDTKVAKSIMLLLFVTRVMSRPSTVFLESFKSFNGRTMPQVWPLAAIPRSINVASKVPRPDKGPSVQVKGLAFFLPKVIDRGFNPRGTKAWEQSAAADLIEMIRRQSAINQQQVGCILHHGILEAYGSE